MSAQQTRAQRMARAALDQVKGVAGRPLAKDYKPRAMGFPAMVLQSGLAQAVGFLAAKGAGDNDKDKAYKRYLDDLAKVCGKNNGTELLNQTISASLPDYRLLTREVLDAAAWLKRFCQTLIKDDKPASENHHGN